MKPMSRLLSLGTMLIGIMLSPCAFADAGKPEHRPVSVDIANNSQVNICFVHVYPSATHLRISGSVGRGTEALPVGPLHGAVKVEAFAGNHSIGVIWPAISSLPRRGHMPLAHFDATFDDNSHEIDHILVEAVATRG